MAKQSTDITMSELDLKHLLDISYKDGKAETTTLPSLAQGQHYGIIEKAKKTDKPKIPPYETSLGGQYMSDRSSSMIQRVGKMDAAERWFFLYLHERIDYKTNIAKISNKELTRTQIVYKTRAFKSLRAHDLIKRVKREHYIFNPRKTIVPIATFEEVVRMWEAL